MSTTGKDAVPSFVSAADRDEWLGLTRLQRKNALVRAESFDAWIAGTLDRETALLRTDLSSSRFYRLAAAWRENRTLKALGAQAGSGAKRRKFKSKGVNAIQAKVAEVVRFNIDDNVSFLVRELKRVSGVADDDLPSDTKIRQIVEAELSRVEATGEAGNAIRFDCCAINIPRKGGRPYIMFACIDAGTRVVLAQTVLPDLELESGYALTAANALEAIQGSYANLPWSSRLSRVELTAGPDDARSKAYVADLKVKQGFTGIQLAGSSKRFGSYIRKHVGTRFGRIALTPQRTIEGDAIPDNGAWAAWTQAEVSHAVGLAIADHNDAVLSELPTSSGRSPAPELRDLLVAMAKRDEREPR